MEPQTSCVTIQKEWDIVGARHVARDMARSLGFSTVDQARIATAVSELARNIYLYAKKGQIYFDIIDSVDRKGMNIKVIDSGPGIEDIGEVMQDGFSTSGGLGAGLPGVKRLMDEFDIESEKGVGTVIYVKKWVR
ncbi:anti-sigma regulatory factor [Oceanobacillus halophilus]|uniref:Anti-sigma regulatory factor n=1 Tax=Oceanobacillus halophilus TaxID=930130 RepID=A0A494ZXV6_9BACI|nr:anti-sigma regulatory factor [Oceanobacillus halophilus]RKQ30932.1 anti-sigma regulatory factor [Oceanobacillus halophilus]